jgi:hypothetical protein
MERESRIKREIELERVADIRIYRWSKDKGGGERDEGNTK